MNQVLISIPSKIKIIPVAIQSVSTYAKIIGFPDKDCSHLELVIEELLTNVIKYDYMPEQIEDIIIKLNISTLGLKICIKSNGIPLDIETIKSFGNVSTSQILSDNFHGLGTLLINKFADIIKYTNRGKDGQEIEIEKYLPAEMPFLNDIELLNESVKIENITNFEFYVRRIYPSEAYIISKLAYFAYKQTYIYDHIYYPERVRQLNQTDELMSYVAVNKANEEIIGHCANIPEKFSDLCELGVAFVNPVYRGAGCLKDLCKYQIQEICKKGYTGFLGNALTSHPYSQKAMYGIGARESALFISKVTSLELNKINCSNNSRESLILMYYYFNNSIPRTVFVPEKHKTIIGKIYLNHSVTNRTLISVSKEKMTLNDEDGVLETNTDPYSCAYIYIVKYGRDTIENIKKTLKAFCLNRLETIYLFMPLECPETSGLCSDFEKSGFFFCGIKPGKANREWLILQYLNNQIYSYENLQFCSEFGRELMVYIQSEDPVSGDK
jgi:anti-sigma regulatory factor (Ser/Thr protein kinase)